MCPEVLSCIVRKIVWLRCRRFEIGLCYRLFRNRVALGLRFLRRFRGCQLKDYSMEWEGIQLIVIIGQCNEVRYCPKILAADNILMS